jgi:predicted DsbA family dithiol-disulfide isomerase
VFNFVPKGDLKMAERDEAPVCSSDGCATPEGVPLAANVAAAAGPVHELGIVSDAICPWCYVGKRRLEKALTMLGDGARFRITWHAFELNPQMPKEGIERRLYRMQKFGSWERSLALDTQLTEVGRGDGIAFRYDLIQRTPNTFNAHRLIWLAGKHERQDAMVEALFRGYFREGRDIGDISVLADLAAQAGLDRAAVLAFLQSNDGAAEVQAEEAIAQNAGLSGVPTFVLDGRVLFSGAQRADLIAQALHDITAGAAQA